MYVYIYFFFSLWFSQPILSQNVYIFLMPSPSGFPKICYFQSWQQKENKCNCFSISSLLLQFIFQNFFYLILKIFHFNFHFITSEWTFFMDFFKNQKWLCLRSFLLNISLNFSVNGSNQITRFYKKLDINTLIEILGKY